MANGPVLSTLGQPVSLNSPSQQVVSDYYIKCDQETSGMKSYFMSDSRDLVCTFFPCAVRRLYMSYNLNYAYALDGVARCASENLFPFVPCRGDPVSQGPAAFLTASLTIHVLTTLCVGL